MPIPTTRASSRTLACGPLSLSSGCSNRFWRAFSICLIWPTTTPSRATSRCSSAKAFGGTGVPLRGVQGCQTFGRLAQGWFEIANAEPGQRALHAVRKPRAFLDQALALPIGPLGVLFGNRRNARHATMAPFATQPPQEPALQQLGVEPIGLCPAMFARHGHTRGMDHMRLDPTRLQPARQPEAVATGFEGNRNPRDRVASLD